MHQGGAGTRGILPPAYHTKHHHHVDVHITDLMGAIAVSILCTRKGTSVGPLRRSRARGWNDVGDTDTIREVDLGETREGRL